MRSPLTIAPLPLLQAPDRGVTGPSRTTEIARAIGRLAIGGDWACAHGDIEALSHVARELAEFLPEPLHCELMALSLLCHGEPLRASAEWPRLRELAFRPSIDAR